MTRSALDGDHGVAAHPDVPEAHEAIARDGGRASDDRARVAVTVARVG